MSKEKLGWLALTLTTLMGCSPCSGEFIGESEACAQGCQGFGVTRFSATCEREAQRWCAPQPEIVTDDYVPSYWFNSDNGDVYVTGGRLEQGFSLPENLRAATEEEKAMVNQCFVP